MLISGVKTLGNRNGNPITASIGVAQRRATHQQIDHLIEAAEQALLVAKEVGGNRVIRFGSLGDTESLQAAADRSRRLPFEGLVARDVMSTPIATLRQDDAIEEAARFLMRHRINSAPVVDNDGRLAGIVSEKDLMTMMSSETAWKRPIREVMTENVVAYDEMQSVYSIYRFLLSSPVRRVVVVNGERPTGVISRGTLLRSFGNWSLERAMGGAQPAQGNAAADHRQSAPEEKLAEQLAGEVDRLAEEVRESLAAASPKSETPARG